MSQFEKIGVTLLVILFSNPGFATNIDIESAWIREAPPVSRIQAAYAIFKNKRDKDSELISASSPGFKKIEFHETIFENGLNKMLRRMTVTIPKKQTVTFEPEGLHMMLFNPIKPLRSGEEIAITFTFKNGDTKTSHFIVKKSSGSNAHQHMNH